MLNELLAPSANEEARTELKSYNVTIPMGSLAIGVDNIHHDVFLSRSLFRAAREYLFDVIRQSTSNTYLPGDRATCLERTGRCRLPQNYSPSCCKVP